MLRFLASSSLTIFRIFPVRIPTKPFSFNTVLSSAIASSRFIVCLLMIVMRPSMTASLTIVRPAESESCSRTVSSAASLNSIFTAIAGFLSSSPANMALPQHASTASVTTQTIFIYLFPSACRLRRIFSRIDSFGSGATGDPPLHLRPALDASSGFAVEVPPANCCRM